MLEALFSDIRLAISHAGILILLDHDRYVLASTLRTGAGAASLQDPSHLHQDARASSFQTSSILLSNDGQSVATKVVVAEGGRLVFIAPLSPLQPFTSYVLAVNGLTAADNSAVHSFELSFTTGAQTDVPNQGQPALKESSQPSSRTRSAVNTHEDPPAPPLQANPGVTALSGETRTVSGKYLPDVTFSLDCDGKTGSARSDSFGRFLVFVKASGHCELEIDGTTSHFANVNYGSFFPGVDLIAGKTNVLPYTVWMTPIDRAHEITIPSPTTRETIITHPNLKGLELHLLSTYRYVSEGEQFYHYGYGEQAELFENGLRPRGYATTAGDLSGAEAQQGLALPHELPPMKSILSTLTLEP